MSIITGQEIDNSASCFSFKESHHVTFLKLTFILPFDVVSDVVVRCFYLFNFEVFYLSYIRFDLLAYKAFIPAICRNRENKSQSNFDSMNGGGKGQFFSLSFGKTTRLKGASKVTLLKPHVSY